MTELKTQVESVVFGDKKYSELPLSSDAVEYADIEEVKGQMQLHLRIPKTEIDLDAAKFKDEEFDSPTTLPEAIDDESLIDSLESALTDVLDLSDEKVRSYIHNDMECTASASDMYAFTLFFNKP